VFGRQLVAVGRYIVLAVRGRLLKHGGCGVLHAVQRRNIVVSWWSVQRMQPGHVVGGGSVSVRLVRCGHIRLYVWLNVGLSVHELSDEYLLFVPWRHWVLLLQFLQLWQSIASRIGVCR